jgi:hypothetical protein
MSFTVEHRSTGVYRSREELRKLKDITRERKKKKGVPKALGSSNHI